MSIIQDIFIICFFTYAVYCGYKVIKQNIGGKK